MQQSSEIQRAIGRLEGAVQATSAELHTLTVDMKRDIESVRVEIANGMTEFRTEFRHHLDNHRDKRSHASNGSRRDRIIWLAGPAASGGGIAAIIFYLLQFIVQH